MKRISNSDLLIWATFEHEGNEMKKVLLASTALAFSAGMAAAQGVELSGYAEIGIKKVEDGFGNSETVFHNDIDVKFTLSGETDNGLTFGATIDLDEVTNAGDDNGIPDNANDSSVFVSGNFGTITMGDTDGALDWAMTEVVWGTSLADDHSTHAGWNGNAGLDGSLDGQVARYEYSFGDFAVAISAEVGDKGADINPDENLGIGLKYSGDFGGTEIGLGLGYQSGPLGIPGVAGGPAPGAGTEFVASGDIIGVSVDAAFAGGFGVRLNYSKVDGSVDGTLNTTTNVFTAAAPIAVEWEHMAVGVGYQMDALLIEANYGKYDGTIAGVGDFDADGYGVAVNYDLGGGAVAMFGYGKGTPFAVVGTAVQDVDTWSAGLGLSF